MIKTVLLSTLLVVGLGASASFAQDRTISVWGHDLEVSGTQTQPSIVALAPSVSMQAEPVQITGRRHHGRRVAAIR